MRVLVADDAPGPRRLLEVRLAEWGGDEREARTAAERVRAGVGGEPVAVGDLRILITSSLAVACGEDWPGADALALIRAPDLALYEAQQNDRSRVRVASHHAPSAVWA